jgi:DNA-binding PadR family transcriptional regulator
MAKTSPTTYGLLGLLAVRSWTGYELTQQLRRSLRFVWPSSEGHLYREQKRLVDLGWATVTVEPVGERSRKRYTITAEGEAALAEWLESKPGEPRFEIEGILRVFYGDLGSPDDLAGALEATAAAAQNMLDEMLDFVDEYLEEGGPLSMLEQGLGGPGADRLEFRGRVMFPERLHVIARVIDITARLLTTIVEFANDMAEQVKAWPTTTDPILTASTRRTLEAIRNRHR